MLNYTLITVGWRCTFNQLLLKDGANSKRRMANRDARALLPGLISSRAVASRINQRSSFASWLNSGGDK